MAVDEMFPFFPPLRMERVAINGCKSFWILQNANTWERAEPFQRRQHTPPQIPFPKWKFLIISWLDLQIWERTELGRVRSSARSSLLPRAAVDVEQQQQLIPSNNSYVMFPGTSLEKENKHGCAP